MFSKLKSSLTYANVTSSLALFLALGGGAAWAANEFTGANIKDDTLTSRDIAPGAVRTSELGNGAVTKAKLRPPEPWRVASLSSASVSGGGSWVTRPGNHSIAFYKDPQGVVHLRGRVCGLPTGVPFCGSGPIGYDSLLTLPAGYRPAKPLTFPTVSENGLGVVYIDEDGLVAATRGDYGSFSLDGVSFRACGEPNAGPC